MEFKESLSSCFILISVLCMSIYSYVQSAPFLKNPVRNEVYEKFRIAVKETLHHVYNASVMEEQNSGLPVTEPLFPPVLFGELDANISFLRVSMAISGSNVFTLDSSSGQVIAKTKLDRELLNHYSLMARATYETVHESEVRYRFSTITYVEIKVLDVNDNSPDFVGDVMSCSVPENEIVGSQISNLTATDMDEGFNKEIEYEIADGNHEGVFAIDEFSGVVTLQKPLDFEKTQRFELSVMAHDRGNRSLSSTSNITVDIRDVNDNKPEFEFSSYHGNISEHVGINETILSIRAQDADSGINKELEYFIVHSDKDIPFYMSNGDIKVERGIERQNHGHVLYNFDVIVHDKGKPPLSSTTHVRIYALPLAQPLAYEIDSDSFNSFLFICLFGMFFFIILLTSI